MSKTEEAIAAIPSVREEAVNQAGVAEEKSPSSCARDLVAGVVVETASCIAREFIKGCAKPIQEVERQIFLSTHLCCCTLQMAPQDF